MIQSESDRQYNRAISEAFGMGSTDEAAKLYTRIQSIWNSLKLPIDFDEICNSSVRTALSMALEDGLPLAQVLRGMTSHLIIIGYVLAEMEQKKERVLN